MCPLQYQIADPDHYSLRKLKAPLNTTFLNTKGKIHSKEKLYPYKQEHFNLLIIVNILMWSGWIYYACFPHMCLVGRTTGRLFQGQSEGLLVFNVDVLLCHFCVKSSEHFLNENAVLA